VEAAVIERIQRARLFGSGQQEVLPAPNIAISDDVAIEHKEFTNMKPKR
jgi:hypothetical protein